jgi:signal peptidase I
MLFINGAYIRSSTDYAECGYKLKEDEYFILGDNKNNSCDSTFFGPILRESIVGKVII